jgi:hypothetical protein
MLLDMRRAPRYHAKSKRSGKRCRSPAHRVCRIHGAGGGGAKGNEYALKHGLTAEAIATRRMIAELTRQAREMVDMAYRAGGRRWLYADLKGGSMGVRPMPIQKWA